MFSLLPGATVFGLTVPLFGLTGMSGAWSTRLTVDTLPCESVNEKVVVSTAITVGDRTRSCPVALTVAVIWTLDFWFSMMLATELATVTSLLESPELYWLI